MSHCPVCKGEERPYFKQRLLGKYDVAYFFCGQCGFLHTEKPYWLEEAYSDAIALADTGLVRRNVHASVRTAALFKWMFGARGKYVDLAGGYGLLTRLMRDMGFDYYWTDRYAQNVLARGFEGSVGGSEVYQAATAFEVLEHLEDPVEFIRQAFSSTHCTAFFFSTVLYSGAEPPQSWWYYTQGTGQHIGFFHRRTLEHIGKELGLRLYSRGSFHLLSKVPVSKPAFALLTSPVNVMLYPILAEKLLKSKIEDDHTRMLEAGQAGVRGGGAN